ncbi:MAG: TonB-dependent receptor [Chlorobi bacterium]|nr:TonB-dependent receptor [Chlorobiota bacterium]
MNLRILGAMALALTSIVAAQSDRSTSRDTLTYRSKAIVVTGTRTEAPIERAPVRVEVIGGSQAQGTAISTVGELLREQAGLLIAPGSVRSGVQMMGLSPDYTLVLLDGQPLTGRVGGVLDLQRVSVGNIERVEVVRGPLSSLYGGDALAGVINIITRRPDDGWHGRTMARYLYHGASEVQTEQLYGSEVLDASMFAAARATSAFDIRTDSDRFAFPTSRDYTLNGRLRWEPATTLRTTLSGRLFGGRTTGPLLQAQAGQITTANGALDMLDQSLSGNVEWYSALGRFTGSLYGTAYREGYTFTHTDGTGQPDSGDSFERRTVRAFGQYDRFVSTRNRAMAGIEFLYDDAGGARYPDRPFYRTAAGFVQWEGNPIERLSYALSLRSDWTSAFGTPRSVLLGGIPMLPRLSVRYMLSDQLALTATVGEGFKAPDMRQLYIRFSPAAVGYQLLGARVLGLDLAPEQSLSAMAGVTLSFDTLELDGVRLERTMFDVIFFANRVHNMIEYFAYQQSPLVFTYRNVASVRTYGMMIMLATSFPAGEHCFDLRGSYQWLAAEDERVLHAIERGTAGYLIPATGQFHHISYGEYYGLWYRPFHSATLRLDWRYRPWLAAMNIRAQYVGPFGDLQRAANPDVYDGTQYLGQLLDSPAELVPGYWMLNVGVEKRVPICGATLVLVCGINNILDVVMPRYVPTAIGRQGFCSIQVEW